MCGELRTNIEVYSAVRSGVDDIILEQLASVFRC